MNEQLTCDWCGTTFTRTNLRGPLPKFCCRGHRQRAFERRQLESLRCFNCKHWERVWDTGIDDSRLPEEDDSRSWGVCSLIRLPERYGHDRIETLAFTMDGSDYRADLHTRSNFGCVHWEAK